MDKYFIRVRKEYIGYFEDLLREGTDDEFCPSVDFEEYNPKEFE